MASVVNLDHAVAVAPDLPPGDQHHDEPRHLSRADSVPPLPRTQPWRQISEGELLEGPSTYDVRKILGFFYPLPPLSAFGTDLQY